jgi:hypothetical protein
MLSAQKEQIRLATSATPGGLPNVDSFGKVVNSIQGLQQRLESFSADAVGAAHDRVQTLLLRLAELQRKLSAFAAIKESMAAVRASLDQMLSECVDLGKIEPLEKSLRIHTLIHGTKLIQFPRLNKLATAAGHQVAPSPKETAPTGSTVDGKSVQAPERKQDLNEEVDTQSLLEIGPPTSELQPGPQFDTPTPNPLEQENKAPALLIPPMADFSPTIASAPAMEAESTAPELDNQQPNSYDLQLPEGTRTDAAASVATEEKTNDAPPVTTNTEFDQRLLDDLIKNYGEFAASLGCSPTSETRDFAAADCATIEADNSVQSIEVAPERNNLPSIKREGEINRQLKEIIKDYGEYDLYSRQSPVNLKTAVVAAFLLLALILSGFYYFSPKTADSQNSLTTAPAHTHSTGAKEPKDSQNLVNQPGVPPVETGAPHATGMNDRPKGRN